MNRAAGVTGVKPTLAFAVFYEFASDLVGVLAWVRSSRRDANVAAFAFVENVRWRKKRQETEMEPDAERVPCGSCTDRELFRQRL